MNSSSARFRARCGPGLQSGALFDALRHQVPNRHNFTTSDLPPAPARASRNRPGLAAWQAGGGFERGGYTADHQTSVAFNASVLSLVQAGCGVP